MKRNFRKSIKKDIQEIDKIISSQEDGKELYETLVAKYCSYDKDFSIGLPPRTVEIPGRPIPSHKKNLLAVKNKLELFLLQKRRLFARRYCGCFIVSDRKRYMGVD